MLINNYVVVCMVVLIVIYVLINILLILWLIWLISGYVVFYISVLVGVCVCLFV